MNLQKPFVKTAVVSIASSCFSLSVMAAQLEETIVTAQKRSQNLQDVSTAVTAFSSDRLNAAGITDIEGLQSYAPSITIGNTFIKGEAILKTRTSTTTDENS